MKSIANWGPNTNANCSTNIIANICAGAIADNTTDILANECR